ncbi:MAG: crotonase/enoyl-CoA hydratase family protein [Polyangiaceae bacterium]
MSTERRSLKVSIADGVAEVVLVGPGKGNAMGPEFWREMPLAFEGLDRDASVRAVLVRGEGGNFSYGLDLMAMAGSLGPFIAGPQMAAEHQRLLDLIVDLQRAFNRVAECRKPVIAAITGWCIGGGLDLAAACDVRLASKDARFSLREVKVAMVSDLGSLQRLPAIIGQGATRELAFTGKNIDADRALRIGLANEVFANEEELLAAARAMAKEIAEGSAVVVQGIKQVMNACADLSVADGLRHVAVWNAGFLQSADLGEALTAFTERRAPRFQGK